MKPRPDVLRVRGVQGLRVADASIMPDIVSASTSTAAMIIGEKAADLVHASRLTPVPSATSWVPELRKGRGKSGLASE